VSMSGVGWVSEIGARIRGIRTWILREDWVADFGGLVMGVGLCCRPFADLCLRLLRQIRILW